MIKYDDHRGLRCVVDIFYAITLIGGAIIAAFGIYFVVAVNRLGEYKPTSLPTLIIIIGILVIVATVLGCFGAHKNNVCLLTAFCAIIGFLIVAQVIDASLVLITQSVFVKAFGEAMKLDIQNQAEFNSDLYYIHELQKEYKCCGGTGPSDWNGKIPESCCANGMPNCSSPYKSGCAQVLFSYVKPVFLSVAVSIFAISLIQLCAVICAACLASKIRAYEKV